MLVRAVLRPHRAEHAQLDGVRRAADDDRRVAYSSSVSPWSCSAGGGARVIRIAATTHRLVAAGLEQDHADDGCRGTQEEQQLAGATDAGDEPIRARRRMPTATIASVASRRWPNAGRLDAKKTETATAAIATSTSRSTTGAQSKSEISAPTAASAAPIEPSGEGDRLVTPRCPRRGPRPPPTSHPDDPGAAGSGGWRRSRGWCRGRRALRGRGRGSAATDGRLGAELPARRVPPFGTADRIRLGTQGAVAVALPTCPPAAEDVAEQARRSAARPCRLQWPRRLAAGPGVAVRGRWIRPRRGRGHGRFGVLVDRPGRRSGRRRRCRRPRCRSSGRSGSRSAPARSASACRSRRSAR